MDQTVVDAIQREDMRGAESTQMPQPDHPELPTYGTCLGTIETQHLPWSRDIHRSQLGRTCEESDSKSK